MITVLVVVEHDGIRGGLRALLEDEGFVVLDAADAVAASGTIVGFRVDLVIVDLALPADGAAQLVADATAQDPEMAIVYLMDGLHRDDSRLPRATQRPRTGIVTCPLQIDDVLACARKVLSG